MQQECKWKNAEEPSLFTAESVITPKDYRALYYFNILHKNRIIKVLGIIIAAAVLVVILSALITGDGGTLIRSAAFVVTVFLAEWGIMELGVRRVIKKDTITLNTPSGYSFYRERIEAFSQRTDAHATYTWEMVSDAWQTREYFYLYLGATHVIILCRRNMKPQEIDLLDAFLRERYGKNYHCKVK